MTTQTDAVLAMLRDRGDAGVTPLDALHEIGCFRLAARVWDARERIGPDEEIVTETMTRDGKAFARYVLRRRLTDAEQMALDL